MRSATMMLMVLGLLLAASCGEEETSGGLTLSAIDGDDDTVAVGDDDTGDDVADDDTAADDDTEDNDPLTGSCPGYERCVCESQDDCFVGLRCWSRHCVNPASSPISGSSGGVCHGDVGCDCSPDGLCFDIEGLECLSGLCVIPEEETPDPNDDDISDDDASDDDAGDDDDSGGDVPACCRSGVCDAAIAVHTMSGETIRAIELNGCVNDNVARPQDCGGLFERAEGIDARSVTWHLSITRQSVVRGNASLYTDSADVNSGAIVGVPNDWAAYGQTNPQLHARVSVRVCGDVVDWLTNADLFSFETGSSFGVDFDDYIP